MRRRRKPRRSFRRRRKSPEKAFWTALAIFTVLAAAGLWLHNSLFTTGTVASSNMVLPATVETEEPQRRTWEPKIPDTHTSILLLGLDNHGMGDVIMILSYDMETYETSLVSIKRDTYVEKQTWAIKELGQDHLAWAHYRGMGPDLDYHAGAGLAALTVEDMLGIDLHAYASITFEGFTAMVDMIGGVVVDVAPQFAERDGEALPPGIQRLSGPQALIYARHRQNPRIAEPGSTSQDGDRVLRNQRLLQAILEQGKTFDSGDILIINDQLGDKFHTSMDDWDILALANIFYNRDPDQIRTVVLPGEGALAYQEELGQEVYYYFLDYLECDSILQELGLK